MTGLRAAPIRPLGVGEMLDAAVRLVRGNARAVLTVAVPFAVVRSALTAMLQYATLDSKNAATVAALSTLLLGVGLNVVLTGLLAPLFGSALLGTQLDAAGSLRRVGRAAWPLVALGVVVMLAEGVGLALCLVGGVWLWGVWAVAAPALVLERTGVLDSLRRSYRIVQGTFWRTWGVRALGWVLTSVLSLFVAVPFTLLAAYLSDSDPLDASGGIAHPALYLGIVSIGAVISGALLAPISAAVDVVIYTDLRMRREGMDIVLSLPPEPRPAGPAPTVTAW